MKKKINIFLYTSLIVFFSFLFLYNFFALFISKDSSFYNNVYVVPYNIYKHIFNISDTVFAFEPISFYCYANMGFHHYAMWFIVIIIVFVYFALISILKDFVWSSGSKTFGSIRFYFLNVYFNTYDFVKTNIFNLFSIIFKSIVPTSFISTLKSKVADFSKTEHTLVIENKNLLLNIKNNFSDFLPSLFKAMLSFTDIVFYFLTFFAALAVYLAFGTFFALFNSLFVFFIVIITFIYFAEEFYKKYNIITLFSNLKTYVFNFVYIVTFKAIKSFFLFLEVISYKIKNIYNLNSNSLVPNWFNTYINFGYYDFAKKLSIKHVIIKNRMFRHSLKFELIWAFVPLSIIVMLLIPSLILLFGYADNDDFDLVVQVIGNQWYWVYRVNYSPFELGEALTEVTTSSLQNKHLLHLTDLPAYMAPETFWAIGLGSPRLLTTDKPLVLPVWNFIKYLVTSADVLHAWAIPSCGVKVDAVPGRLTQTTFCSFATGVFFGQCSELCGVEHGFMPITVIYENSHIFNKATWRPYLMAYFLAYIDGYSAEDCTSIANAVLVNNNSADTYFYLEQLRYSSK